MEKDKNEAVRVFIFLIWFVMACLLAVVKEISLGEWVISVSILVTGFFFINRD